MRSKRNSNHLKIIIYTSEPFPNGWAATNRIISYAIGFLSHQKKVSVICIRKTENFQNVTRKNTIGLYRNIPYRYLANSTKKANTFLQRRVDVILMNFRLFISSLRVLDKNTLAIYYSDRTSAAIILRITSWLKGCKIVKEESEYPEVYSSGKVSLKWILFRMLHYRLFDGLLLMTNNLIEYFKVFKHYKKPILHVPMTVDFNRFNLSDITRKKTVAYCGTLNDEKDGIDILLKAFVLVSKLHPDYTLSLYGAAENDDRLKSYKQTAQDSHISDHVFFHGKVSIDRIPRLLSEASILVLPRPCSIQAFHGFPTKLGEYLATGNPVIATPVGEIPLYLKDRVHVVYADPGSSTDLAEKIIMVIENKGLSEEIGRNGKSAAMKYFNNINQTEEILNFYKEL